MRMLVFLMVLLCFTPQSGRGEDLTATQLLTHLQRCFHGAPGQAVIGDMQAEFYQKARIASLNRTQTGRGEMAMLFEQGDDGNLHTLFRWHYTVPNQQLIVCDAATLWVYLPDNNQVMVSDINDQSQYSEDPLLFLRNLAQLAQHFRAEWATPARDEQGNHRLLLTPLQPSVYISTLTLTLPPEMATEQQAPVFPLRGASIVDPTGNTTELEFRNVQTNQQLKRQLFQFTIPENVQTVRPSELKLDFK